MRLYDVSGVFWRGKGVCEGNLVLLCFFHHFLCNYLMSPHFGLSMHFCSFSLLNFLISPFLVFLCFFGSASCPPFVGFYMYFCWFSLEFSALILLRDFRWSHAQMTMTEGVDSTHWTPSTNRKKKIIKNAFAKTIKTNTENVLLTPISLWYSCNCLSRVTIICVSFAGLQSEMALLNVHTNSNWNIHDWFICLCLIAVSGNY